MAGGKGRRKGLFGRLSKLARAGTLCMYPLTNETVMNQLKDIVGAERSLDGVCQAIHLSAVERRPQAVGAMHITCADESENECVSSFQRCFVKFMLPSLKFAQQSAFRIANLGGRYDWGAVRIAEQHYAAAAPSGSRLLLVVKVNAHAGVMEGPNGITYGVMERYGSESSCCGALHGLLKGDSRPFAEDLAELFVSEGPNRLAALRDTNSVDPSYRFLYAAIVSARLQARKVILDIQDYGDTNTEFLVIPCVTLNRPERDTEIVCGYYLASPDQGNKEPEYYGLGDDPTAFTDTIKNRRLVVSDSHVGTLREARDHRQLALAQWHELTRDRRVKLEDKRLEHARHQASKNTGPRHERSRIVLKALLAVLADVDPVSATVLLFAHGAGGIHHAFRVHRLARKLETSHEARKVLAEIRDRIDTLKPEQAEAMMEILSKEYHT